jgi:hypothetical protein
MDSHLVFVKTDKGREEIAQRTYGLTQRSRVVLIMVDGASDVATLQTRLLSMQNLPSILEELALNGFIAVKSGEWQRSVGRDGAGGLDARIAPRTPAEAKAALIDMAIMVLGDDAGRIAKKLREAPDTLEGLREATASCKKLVDLTIDEAKGAELKSKCAEILSALDAAGGNGQTPGGASFEDTRSQLIDLTIAVLGKDVEPVTRKLHDAPATAAALKDAVQQCCKLVRLTIDEGKARKIEQEAGRLLG